MSFRSRRECKNIPSLRAPLSKGLTFALWACVWVTSLLKGRALLGAPVERALSQAERVTLSARAAPLRVTLLRTSTLRQGAHRVGDGLSEGRGLALSERVVLTVASSLALAPLERFVSLRRSAQPLSPPPSSPQRLKRGRPGDEARRREAIYTEATPLFELVSLPQEGLALLSDTPPDTPQVREGLIKEALSALDVWLKRLPQRATLSAPRGLWAVTPGEREPHRVMVLGRAQGPDAFFWRVSAPLVWGEPLFDAEGAWVSLSVGRGLLLPLSAVRALYAQLRGVSP